MSTMGSDLFPQRLAEAIEHLSPEQLQALESWAVTQPEGASGGVKAWIARQAGMSTPSILSDLLAGRSRGLRYRLALSDTLGVDAAWLDGEAEPLPEWKLTPYGAYSRWIMTISAGIERLKRSIGMGGVEDSDVARPPSSSEAEWWCRRLSLPSGHQTVLDLLAKRYAQVSFETLIITAGILGVAAPHHPAHVRQGHAIAEDVAREVDNAVAGMRRRYLRYLLPASLFQLTRYALMSLKGDRSYRGKSVQPVDDALELLWRQEIMRLGRNRDVLPAEYTQETGRSVWTPLKKIQTRYPDDGHFHPERYESRR